MNNRSSPLNLLASPFKNGLPRGMLFGGILLGALLAFEIFNYSTTDFALTDLLGSELKFAGVRWALYFLSHFAASTLQASPVSSPPKKGATNPPKSGISLARGCWPPR